MAYWRWTLYGFSLNGERHELAHTFERPDVQLMKEMINKNKRFLKGDRRLVRLEAWDSKEKARYNVYLGKREARFVAKIF